MHCLSPRHPTLCGMGLWRYCIAEWVGVKTAASQHTISPENVWQKIGSLRIFRGNSRGSSPTTMNHVQNNRQQQPAKRQKTQLGHAAAVENHRRITRRRQGVCHRPLEAKFIPEPEPKKPNDEAKNGRYRQDHTSQRIKHGGIMSRQSPFRQWAIGHSGAMIFP